MNWTTDSELLIRGIPAWELVTTLIPNERGPDK